MSNNAHEVLSAISEAISAFHRVPDLLAEIARLQEINGDKDETIELLGLEISSLVSRNDTLNDTINGAFGYKAEIETLKKERASLQDENSVLSAENHMLKDQLYAECDNGSRLAALVSLKDAEINSLTIQVSDNRSLADKFKSALDKIMGNINEVTPIEIAPTATAPEVVDSTGFPGSNEPVMANPLERNSFPPLAPMGNPDSATDEPVTIITDPSPNDLKPLSFSPETEEALVALEATERRYGYWV